MGRTFLVLRFSALGDVALAVPVLKQVVASNPDAHFIMVSDCKWADVFHGIERVRFQGFDLQKKYRGFLGIISIYRFLLINYQFEAVADLHSVIRTHILKILFFFSGKEIASVDKGRLQKTMLTRKNNKQLYQLPHTTERYIKVFEQLRLSVNHQQLTTDIIQVKKGSSAIKKIGFAPFAKHPLKMYPLDRMLQVIEYFNKEGFELYFFGSGLKEREYIHTWDKKFQHAVQLPESATLNDELSMMRNLDVMVSMDSGNMHLASMVGVPVVSIWGPTHPYAGFYGHGQDPDNAVQESLACRPCSVFGNKACWRGDHACMRRIKSEDIILKIEELLN